jgi:hypothetical protein
LPGCHRPSSRMHTQRQERSRGRAEPVRTVRELPRVRRATENDHCSESHGHDRIFCRTPPSRGAQRKCSCLQPARPNRGAPLCISIVGTWTTEFEWILKSLDRRPRCRQWKSKGRRFEKRWRELLKLEREWQTCCATNGNSPGTRTTEHFIPPPLNRFMWMYTNCADL